MIDCLTLPTSGLAPVRELVRVVRCDAGAVELEWAWQPRFGFGLRAGRLDRRAGHLVAATGGEAVGLVTHGCGDADVAAD